MGKRTGRPSIYQPLLVEALDKSKLYSPASATQALIDKGLIQIGKDDDAKKVRTRVRHALARLSKNKRFPEGGDMLVRMPGQTFSACYYGWRWIGCEKPAN